MNTTELNERLLDLQEVRKLIPLSRSSFYKWSRRGDFPAPVRLPGARLAWRQSEVQKWIRERPAVAGQKDEGR